MRICVSPQVYFVKFYRSLDYAGRGYELLAHLDVYMYVQKGLNTSLLDEQTGRPNKNSHLYLR